LKLPRNCGTVSKIGDMRCPQITFLLAITLLPPFPTAQPDTLDACQSQAQLRDFILDTARRTHQTGAQTFEDHYEFVHIKITEERNSNGELKDRQVEHYHHHPTAAGDVAANPSPDRHRTSSKTRDNKAVSRDDFTVDADMLRRFSFQPAGEDFRGDQPQLVIDFQPASESLPVHNFKDKYINQTTGRLWIDKELQVLTRLQMRLRKPVNVWGGILGAISEFQFDLERAPTPEGYWYTRKVQWHLKGRKLFTSKIIDFHEERSDVQLAKNP
jgi:hypothetical protein